MQISSAFQDRFHEVINGNNGKQSFRILRSQAEPRSLGTRNSTNFLTALGNSAFEGMNRDDGSSLHGRYFFGRGIDEQFR